jgi:alcohol dehydrogenase, propanol-preferring
MTSTTYRAIQATAPGGLELVERELVAPPPGKVRIRVEVSGVCHDEARFRIMLLTGDGSRS